MCVCVCMHVCLRACVFAFVHECTLRIVSKDKILCFTITVIIIIKCSHIIITIMDSSGIGQIF